MAVLPLAEANARYAASACIDRSTHVLLPGLVNAHTHAGMSLLRGVADYPPLEHRWLDPEFVRDGVELAIACMVASGTTCFSEQYLYPDVIAQTAGHLQMRACIGLPVMDTATAWASSSDEYIRKGLALRDDYSNDPLISTAFAPCAPIADPALERLCWYSNEIELPVTMHLHESTQAMHGMRPIERIERLGLLTAQFSGVHMTQIDAQDIDRLVRGGSSVVHCPQTNLQLGNGICPAATMVNRGVNVALGTGAAGNNLLEEMRVAALLAGTALTAHEWLRVATLNGARTIGLADSIGSLTPGKWADLCCIDLNDIHMQPAHDPAAAIVYAANRSNVSDVWVAGRQLLAERKFTRCDTDAMLARTSEWQARIGRGL